MKRQDKIALERYRQKIDFSRNAINLNPFETKAQQIQRITKSKVDFAFMVQNYFPHYATAATPDFHVKFANKLVKNKTHFGMVAWGRALAKSVVNNILIPFWLWMRGEPIYFVLIGNNYDRAKQLLEDLRAEFEANPMILHDFGEQHKPGSWEDGFFITKGGFIGQALGLGQSVRGLRVKNKRPTHICCDDTETKDLLKNPKRMNEMVHWIERDLLPTMDGDIRRYLHVNNRSAHVMVMTKLRDRHPDWDWNQVNAYDPVSYTPTWIDKYTAKYFKEKEKESGVLAANAEYNNAPHVEGSIFSQDQIQWGKLPRLNQFDIICGFWDVAYAGTSTSDYNAVVLQGLHKQQDFWEIDCFVKQSKMWQAIAWMCLWQKEKPPTVHIHWLYEAQFWNEEIERTIAEVQLEHNVELNLIQVNNPKTRKYDRMLSMHPTFQNGRFYYDQRKKAHTDTQTGIAQLLGIEPGYKSKDDYPDAKEAGKSFLEKHINNQRQGGSFSLGRMKKNNLW